LENASCTLPSGISPVSCRHYLFARL